MKELYPFIEKRKSTRKYDLTPLSGEELAETQAAIDSLVPLFSHIPVQCKIVGENDVKIMLPIKAPHYLVIASEEVKNSFENVGFLYQQMDLFFASKGYGSCWLGMGKPAKGVNLDYPFVIAMAFGKALESPYREIGEFKRKRMEEICAGDDPRMAAARLAPSASNSQRWYFQCEDGKIHVFLEKISGIQARMYGKMNQIDIGIALCHIMVASAYFDLPFSFALEDGVSLPKGKNYQYMGTVLDLVTEDTAEETSGS